MSAEGELHIGISKWKEGLGGGERRVQYSGAYYGEAEIHAVTDVLNQGEYLGPAKENHAFETELATFLGTKYAHTCNSGSSANLLALAALDLPEDSKVVTAACGFPTTVNPIIQRHLIPLFVDTDLETLNPIPEQVMAAMHVPGVSAIFFAHTLGNPNPMDVYVDQARKLGIKVIEDNCDALGSQYKGRFTGTYGDLSTISMYPAHHITAMGHGGAVFTSHMYQSVKVKMFRDWGRGCWCADEWESPCGDRFGFKLNDGTPWDHRYFWQEIGYNLAMTEPQAAFGRVQLRRLEWFITRRKENFAKLYTHFSKHYPHIFTLAKALPDADPSWFGFPITIRDGVKLDRNHLQRQLEKYGIQTRTHFGGNLLRHPAYHNIRAEVYPSSLHNSDKIARDTLFLGVWQGITQEDIDYMLQVFDKLLHDLS